MPSNVTGWPLVNHVVDKVLTVMDDVSKSFKSIDWAVPKFGLEEWLGWTCREML